MYFFSVSEKSAEVTITSECIKQITFDGLTCRIYGTACFPHKASIVKKRKVYDPKGEYKLIIMDYIDAYKEDDMDTKSRFFQQFHNLETSFLNVCLWMEN